MFGFLFHFLDNDQVTHGLKQSLDRDMGFEVTNSLDKRLDWVMFGGRKMVPTASNLVFRLRLETEH
ncbi:hypothetical protein AtNW77_Chr4g0309741 [Arabidopsis thaliana]|jgi:hypothetical protein